ncbi:TolC family protein [Thermosulfurimonas dismutans]|uniref:Outer membrane protein, RND efflux system n=1 Tax=Thermosulfurimonas dismutans TaxID=999894 RepID=A0A179D5X4_9BACT|nr:TolC family protein [Thermosulfurimonas dismutans]OAQ20842.1 Outer membrane protein, RND efflux system precursor [Thermosulfurimonas dismutans]
MKKGLWLLLWLCFWPGFLKAETLTLSKIYELALSRHPLIRAAEAEVEAARAGVREAKGAFLPQIDLRELYARTDSPPQVFSYKLAQKNFKPEDFLIDRLNHPTDYSNWKTQLVITQPIFNQGREIIGYRKAMVALSQAEDYLQAVRHRVLFEAESAYLRLRLAQERVAVLEEAVRTARENLRVVERRYAAGQALKSDLLEAQVFLSRQEKDLESARHELEVAASALNLALGLPLDTRWEIPEEAIQVPKEIKSLENWLTLARQNRPDLRIIKHRKRLSELDLKEARYRFLPSLNLKGIYEKNSEDPLGGGADGEAYIFLAELNFNLFKGFQDKARLAKARARLLSEKEKLRQYQREVEHQVREAYSRLLTARREVMVTEKAVARAEEGLRIIRKRYEAGLSLLVELQDAETALKRARLLHLEALYGERQAFSRLRYVSGTIGGTP